MRGHLVECTDDFLMAVARILGSSSAASQAIAERDRRRALGKDAVVLWDERRGILFVGPSIAGRKALEERR